MTTATSEVLGVWLAGIMTTPTSEVLGVWLAGIMTTPTSEALGVQLAGIMTTPTSEVLGVWLAGIMTTTVTSEVLSVWLAEIMTTTATCEVLGVYLAGIMTTATCEVLGVGCVATRPNDNTYLRSPGMYDEGHGSPHDGQSRNNSGKKHGPVIQGLWHPLLPWFQLGFVELLQRKTQLLETKFKLARFLCLTKWNGSGLVYDYFPPNVLISLQQNQELQLNITFQEGWMHSI